jgi:Zn-dependent protease with chaperone function
VKKSVDTKRVNAYVTGIGSTKRIVLWDTLLEKLDDDQIEFIMGHEMGHYVLGHVTMLIFGGTAVVLVALLFIHKFSRWILRRYAGQIGFDELHDVASVPLMVLLLNFCQLSMAPVMMATSRYHEHEADRFGLELTRDNRAAATSFLELQRHNLSVPRPGGLYVFWRASHPTLGDRIDFCNTYRPWERGEALVYGSLFEK